MGVKLDSARKQTAIKQTKQLLQKLTKRCHKKPLAMAVKVDCARARVYIKETKRNRSNEKNPGEGSAKFRARLLQERYQIYSQHFMDYPQLHISQHDFNRSSKVIDAKIRNWRSKTDKESYVTRFSISNWNQGREITKDAKKEHSLSSSKACFLFNSHLQSTFPLNKAC